MAETVGPAAQRKVDPVVPQWCGSFEPMRIPRPKFSDMEWIPPADGTKTGYYRSVRRKQRRAYPALPQEFQRQLEAKINGGGGGSIGIGSPISSNGPPIASKMNGTGGLIGGPISSNGLPAASTPSLDRNKVLVFHNTGAISNEFQMPKSDPQ